MKLSEKAHILVVDDNAQNLVAINSILEELNQSLIFATSAKEALRYVLQYDFAVILLDVQMPEIDGFEIARLIRLREKSSYTPIIFLSAWYKDEIDVSMGYKMGAVDYIFKPIDPVTLRCKVQVFVDLFTKSTLAVKLKAELQNRLRAEQQAKQQKHQLELARLERANLIEEMSSALSHELNQPLTIIANYVRGCIHRLEEGHYDVRQLISVLHRTATQAERAGFILHRIKNLVRRNKLYLEPVMIQDLVTNASLLLSDEIYHANIKITCHFSKDQPPKIMLDKIQFEQVLLNLLRNSIEVLKEHQNPAPHIEIETLFDTPGTLTVKVKDNGPGISPGSAAKLFDLYFTTKAHGMGVGLSVCRTIIEAHGGSITAYNNPEGGACFQITLPTVANHVTEAA